jgi:hypothetical protein
MTFDIALILTHSCRKGIIIIKIIIIITITIIIITTTTTTYKLKN